LGAARGMGYGVAMTLTVALRTLLSGTAKFCAQKAILIVLIAVLAMAGSARLAATRLGVSTNTDAMFADSLPWKQRSKAISKAFPQNSGLLVAVVDAPAPETADAVAAILTARIAADHQNFYSVTNPAANPYFHKNGFLLIGTSDLQDVLDHTLDAQPFLGQLVADPSMRGLFGALSLVAKGVEHHAVDTKTLEPAMVKFHLSLASAIAGSPEPLSWQNLLGGKLADQAGKYRFVLAKPKLNYLALEAGGVATTDLRAMIASIPLVQQGQARVRLTGGVVLADEEFSTVAQGAASGLLASFALVLLWLYLAVRSWRLMLPIILTLIAGLMFTTAFAAIAIGTLNLISVAFAVLFVGIAVDFAIQFVVRFREYLHATDSIEEDLRHTTTRAGVQILVASLATSAGFLAFTPTDFTGVAELGEIAGVGMLIAFFCTITILPAMLTLCRPRESGEEIAFAWARPVDPWIVSHRAPILAAFACLAIAGMIAVPRLGFDGDPLHTKKQDTEAVQTLLDLMDDPVANPYTIEALFPSRAAAADGIKRVLPLPFVKEVLSFQSFVPEEQDKKLAMIADAAGVLSATLAPPANPPALSAADLRKSARDLFAQITALGALVAPQSGLGLIRGDLAGLVNADDATLFAANTALTQYLPAQLDQLRLALSATKITDQDVPADIRRDWLLPDGSARIQIIPEPAIREGKNLKMFVTRVEAVLPQAAGSAVWIVNSAITMIRAFSTAALFAIIAIAIILALALRRVTDVMLVMTPLMVSALLTVFTLYVLGITLNFANVIALPLLLGVGVSFNIYFVMNWRGGRKTFVGSPTARAIVFSALTTGTAFGSLAVSQHPGTASMGDLLLISLASTVITTILFVPALLACFTPPDQLGKTP